MTSIVSVAGVQVPSLTYDSESAADEPHAFPPTAVTVTAAFGVAFVLYVAVPITAALQPARAVRFWLAPVRNVSSWPLTGNAI